MPSSTKLLALSTEQRGELERLARRLTTPQGLAIRARIILGVAAGMPNLQLARELHTTVPTVLRWQRRWAVDGIAGIIGDRARSGRSGMSNETREVVDIGATRYRKLEDSALWSARALSAASGVTPVTAEEIWSTYDPYPATGDYFRFSASSELASGLRDFVGLYISPSKCALLVSSDERDCSTPEDRLQCGHFNEIKSLQERKAETCFDRVNTFMAVLSLMCEEMNNRCRRLDGEKEFIDFLERADLAVERGLSVHSLISNYHVLRPARVRTWIGEHPRWHVHFSSLGGSWLVHVLDWLDKIGRLDLQPDAFCSASSVVQAVLAHSCRRDPAPGPFQWTLS